MKRRAVWVFALAGLVCWFVAGASRVVFTGRSSPFFYGVRALAAATAFWFAALYLVSWYKLHAKGVPRRIRVHPDVLSAGHFHQYKADKLLVALRPEVERFSDVLEVGVVSLAEDLLRPAVQRLKVTEEVELSTQQSSHRVLTKWRQGSSVEAAQGRVLPILRPMKTETPREISVANGRQLSAFESVALLVVVLSRLIGVDPLSTEPAVAEFQRLALLWVTFHPDRKKKRPKRARVVAAGQMARLALDPSATSTFRKKDLTDLLQCLAERRPHFAYYAASTPVDQTEFTFRLSLSKVPPSPHYDSWRERKDGWRRLLGFPPRVVYLNLERARSAASYQLYVKCHESLYFEEADVIAANAFISPLPRWKNYPSYIGWEAPSGKAFISLGAANLSQTKLNDPQLALRVTEKPPGTLAAAASTAFGTMIAIWLVGVASQRPATGVDLVAFILAIPAVASTALGLLSVGRTGGLRSLTALLSLIASLGISLIGIIMLFVEGYRPVHQRRLPNGNHFFLLSNWVWIILFVIACVNLAVASGTFVNRIAHYRSLIRGPRATRRKANL